MQKIFTSATQYGDIKGNVTIDGMMGGNLSEFAKNNGINTDQYFPIGIEIYVGENDFQSLSIIAIDKNAIGLGTTYDNVKTYLEQNEEVDVKKIDLPNTTLNDYLKLCKRFSIAASSIPELMHKTINIV
jgi:hypothetical protein